MKPQKKAVSQQEKQTKTLSVDTKVNNTLKRKSQQKIEAILIKEEIEQEEFTYKIHKKNAPASNKTDATLKQEIKIEQPISTPKKDSKSKDKQAQLYSDSKLDSDKKQFANKLLSFALPEIKQFQQIDALSFKVQSQVTYKDAFGPYFAAVATNQKQKMEEGSLANNDFVLKRCVQKNEQGATCGTSPQTSLKTINETLARTYLKGVNMFIFALQSGPKQILPQEQLEVRTRAGVEEFVQRPSSQPKKIPLPHSPIRENLESIEFE